MYTPYDDNKDEVIEEFYSDEIWCDHGHIVEWKDDLSLNVTPIAPVMADD